MLPISYKNSLSDDYNENYKFYTVNNISSYNNKNNNNISNKPTEFSELLFKKWNNNHDNNNVSNNKAQLYRETAWKRTKKFNEEKEEENRYKMSPIGKNYLSTHTHNLMLAFGLIIRLLITLAHGMWRGCKGIRDVRFFTMFYNIAYSRQTLINNLAFAANFLTMNLSTVQVSHRLEPLLNLLKIRKFQQLQTSSSFYYTFLQESKIFSPYNRLKSSPPISSVSSHPQMAPNCCTLDILAEPPPGQPIRADIVFIHGLNGSLGNTWRQGLWENYRGPEQFERPPKPPIRPPKRPRYSRTTQYKPPHKQKRPRIVLTSSENKLFSAIDSHTESTDELVDETSNNCTNVSVSKCDTLNNSQRCNETIQYTSFSTFRLRLNHKSRMMMQSEENCLNSCHPCKLTRDDPNYAKCWPGDWLPLDCPGVRVMAINYTTDPHLWRPMWKKKERRTNLIQRSREMTELLVKYQVGCGHPIVYVGHSKGGLFVKQIIVDAWESGRATAVPLWRSARGVLFYSVPHRGSNLASLRAPLMTRSVELIDIEKNSKYLLDLHRRFVGLYHMGHLNVEVFSFVETAFTLLSFLYLRIVGVDSADPGIGDVCGIRLDHREICKPRSRNCILYKELIKMIEKVC